MNCSSCGAQLPPGATNCPGCGAVTPYYYSTAGTAPNDPTIMSPSTAGAQQPPPPTGYGSQPYGTVPATPYDAPPYGAGPQAPYGGTQPYGAGPQTPYGVPPYQGPYGSPQVAPPPPSPQPRRPGNRVAVIVAVVLLVLILVGGGLFALLLRSKPGPGPTSTTNNTPVAPATPPPGTAEAVVPPTVQNSYGQNGTLAFSDPLSDNSQNHGWDVNSTNCAFTGGAYHVIAPDARYSDYCLAETPKFGNFVFEVQMTIIKGDAGGVVFRVTSTSPTNQNYEFDIGQDQSYILYLRTGNAATDLKTLTKGSNPAIKAGLNQTNVIAVVAMGNAIKLYVNHQLITGVTDNTYSQGQIGMIADPNNNPTEIAFSNAKVWTL